MITTDERPSVARISTGTSQADEILNGGFPSNSINMIMGLPGAGKSVFVEQLVFHNAGGPRPILYLTTLSEPMSKMTSSPRTASRLSSPVSVRRSSAMLRRSS